MIKVGLFSDKIDGDCPIGMGNIALQIAKQLHKTEEIDLYLVHHQFVRHPIYSECKNIILPSVGPRRLTQYLDPFVLKRHRLDIMHYPDHNMLPFFLKPARYVIVTMHGMSAIFGPEEFAGKPFNRRAERAIQKNKSTYFDHIASVSSFLKTRIIEKYAIAPQIISVIPNGVDLSLFRQYKVDQNIFTSKFGLKTPYIFHVSSLKAIKNPPGILEGFKIISEKRKEVNLAISGGNPLNLWVMKKKAEELGLTERVKFLGTTKSDDLVSLFNNTELLLFPSYFEGFGLPVLEAMACGCPVVASDIPPFREFANNCVLMVDPNSPEEIASACLRLLADPGLREKLATQGKQRAQQYSWDRIAERILGLYKALVITPEGR